MGSSPAVVSSASPRARNDLSGRELLIAFSLLAAIAAILAAAAYGALLAAVEVTQPEVEAVGVGAEIRTSFGLVTVTDIGALTDDHDGHAGAGHFTGPGTIPEDTKALQVSVVIANTTDREAAYSPDAFVLRVGADDRVGHSDATFLRGSLLPGGIIHGQLTFLVPADAATGTLEFSDRGRAAPLFIDLGDLSGAATGHDDDHAHDDDHTHDDGAAGADSHAGEEE